MSFHSALYRGQLMHARSDEHARRAFRYPVFMASLDLDELDALDRELRLFSRDGFNLFAFHDADYAATLSPSARDVAISKARIVSGSSIRGSGLETDTNADSNADSNADPNGDSYRNGRPPSAHTAGTAGSVNTASSRGSGLEGGTILRSNRDLRESLDALHDGAELKRPARVRLVTNLRTLGYVFNPVSFFLGYDAAGTLATVVAEVNNTYGGRLRYLLGPRDRLPDRRGRIGFRHVRELFVSPFLHGEATYDFWFDPAIDPPALAIGMHVWQHERRVFVARLQGTRAALTDRTLALAALRYPMMSAQVIGLIHWQALKLRLAGVRYRRPRADHRPLVVVGSD